MSLVADYFMLCLPWGVGVYLLWLYDLGWVRAWVGRVLGGLLWFVGGCVRGKEEGSRKYQFLVIELFVGALWR